MSCSWYIMYICTVVMQSYDHYNGFPFLFVEGEISEFKKKFWVVFYFI